VASATEPSEKFSGSTIADFLSTSAGWHASRKRLSRHRDPASRPDAASPKTDYLDFDCRERRQP
jgi:hypothetical protein